MLAHIRAQVVRTQISWAKEWSLGRLHEGLISPFMTWDEWASGRFSSEMEH